jgi:hypothetical protein
VVPAETTRVAGTSTGTFAVSAIVGGLDDEQFKQALQLMLQRCGPYLDGGLTGVLRVRTYSCLVTAGGAPAESSALRVCGSCGAQTQLQRTLYQVLPEDIHLRAKDRGWVSVWIEDFPPVFVFCGEARGSDVAADKPQRPHILDHARRAPPSNASV